MKILKVSEMRFLRQNHEINVYKRDWLHVNNIPLYIQTYAIEHNADFLAYLKAAKNMEEKLSEYRDNWWDENFENFWRTALYWLNIAKVFLYMEWKKKCPAIGLLLLDLTIIFNAL